MAPKSKFTKEEIAEAALRIVREKGSDCLTAKAIADALNICNRSLNNKMNGRVPFTWDEVKLIRSQFFPDMSPDDLFMTNAS